MSPIKPLLATFTAGALAVALFTGCSANKVSIIGEKRVEIIKHKSITDGKFLKLVAELKNDDSDETEGFVYRVKWFDDNGILKDTTSWKPIVIHKNQRVQIVEMSNLTDVTSYEIEVSVPEKL